MKTMSMLSQHYLARLSAAATNRVLTPGEQVMLSVVRVVPNSAGSINSHPEEQ